MNRRLKVMAARHALGLSHMEELIDAAHSALADGVYSYSLGELATQYQPNSYDSERLFLAAMRELGIPSLDPEVCIAYVIDAAAVRLIEEVDQPVEVIHELYQDYVALGYDDLDELIPWVRFEYQLDEIRADYPRSDTANAAVEMDNLVHEIIQHARTWNRDRWRPVVQPAWLSSTVLAIAAGIRDDRAFDRLPILADALQDAGCENDDILGHLRHAATHDRTCWVVELLTEFGASGG